jgi:hypothetical protein
MDLDDPTQLLHEFGRLEQLPRVERTILEIAGFPHYERAASNILAFFLDPENGHGLERGVLQSVLAAAGSSNTAGSDLEDITVEREAPTGSGFLDLLVETSFLTVGIENKIFAKVYNDLGDYAQFVNSKAAQAGKKPVLILLTLRSIDAAVNLSGFQPVTYEAFFDHLTPKVARQLPGANPRYVNYLMDFVRTIQNLGRPEVSTAIREFVRDNSERLLALQKHLKSLRDEIDRKLGEVSDRVNVSEQPPWHPVIGPRPYNAEWRESFTRIRYWLVDAPGHSNPAVNLRLAPKGWQGDVATKVQLVIDALRQPPNAPG